MWLPGTATQKRKPTATLQRNDARPAKLVLNTAAELHNLTDDTAVRGQSNSGLFTVARSYKLVKSGFVLTKPRQRMVFVNSPLRLRNSLKCYSVPYFPTAGWLRGQGVNSLAGFAVN